MTFDLIDKDAADAYKILASLVTPRPIAWVTTLNAETVVNAAPFSFFNVFGSNPPLVAFAPGDRAAGVPKDTARNIRENGEFVIHLVDASMAEAMNATAASLPYGESELDRLGLSLVAGESVSVPWIREAPAALECRQHSTIEIGSNRVVLGIVQRVHVREGILDPKTKHINVDAYQPIGRMASPSWYCQTDHLFEMERPK